MLTCPKCGAATTVIDTRRDLDGFERWRRRRCGNGHTFGTREKIMHKPVPEPPENFSGQTPGLFYRTTDQIPRQPSTLNPQLSTSL